MVLEVCVPATTANLGCGFDVLGMALNLFYQARVVVEQEQGFSILHRGEGEGMVPSSEENLFFRSVLKTWERIGFSPVGLQVEAYNQIPIARGLGSSAACIVAGVLAANCVAGNILSREEMIRVALEMEGHPDNLLPAFLGGFTIALARQGKVYYRKLSFFQNIEMVLCIPQYGLSTERMRQLLPEVYPRDQVIFNLAHLAYLLGSLFIQDFSGFFLALEDSVHQPYRGREVKGFFAVKEYIQNKNLGNAVISGSGPTVLVFLNRSLSQEETETIKSLFYESGAGEVTLKRVQWIENGAMVRVL
ncbi:MAG: homoserine kinase [Candidatus Caldatribacteriaceae bacterium]